MGLAFGTIMVANPLDWPKYNLNPQDGLGRYYATQELGGGTLAGEITVGSVTIETPLYDLWSELHEKLLTAYVNESGEYWAGGYYLLMDLQASEDEPNEYLDVALYTDPDAMSHSAMELLAAKNYTGDYDMSNPDPAEFICCASDLVDPDTGAGLVAGMARTIRYRRDPATAEVTEIQWIYEGMIADGMPSGFGRLMVNNGGVYENTLAYFEDAERANGRYAYFRDFDLMWAGEVPPGGEPVSFREPPENPINGDSFDDFVD